MWWYYGGEYFHEAKINKAFQCAQESGIKAGQVLKRDFSVNDPDVQDVLNNLGVINLCLLNSKMILNAEVYSRYHPRESLNKRLFFNLGAGPIWIHPFWTTLDIRLASAFSLDYDLLDQIPLPIETESAEIIYSSHTLEHVDDASTINFLLQAHRSLKPGGCLRLVTPDVDLMYAAYRKGFIEHFSYLIGDHVKTGPIGQCFLHEFAAHLSSLCQVETPHRMKDHELANLFNRLDYEDALNHCTAQCSMDLQRKVTGGAHVNWFNAKKLVRMVEEAGFEQVEVSACGQSKFPVLRDFLFFDNTTPGTSVYVEAIK